MTTKRAAKEKTIWVARQTKDTWHGNDEYVVFVQKSAPKLEENTDWTGKITHYFANELVTMCAPQWHRATGIRLKRGEVAKIKVTLVK